MSKDSAYGNTDFLKDNDVATAAAVELIKTACGSAATAGGVHALEWATKDDNLKKLRDKIKESASKQ
jgi:hypothetical protein